LDLRQRKEDGYVAWVRIHNESRRNALNSALMSELAEVFHKLATIETLRAVVLTGAGEKAFSGGVDIEEMAALKVSDAKAFITRLHSVCQAIRDLPVPVIACIRGYALGGAMEVAASCDLRIAGASARFGMPEVRLSIQKQQLSSREGLAVHISHLITPPHENRSDCDFQIEAFLPPRPALALAPRPPYEKPE
jgi:enoyl-CoA hydratase/carnithine racemase